MTSGTDSKQTVSIHWDPEPKELKGSKSDSSKPPVTLIPPDFIFGMADVFAFGAKKYGRWNYTKGIEISRTLDAAMRHLLAFAQREDLDPETQKSHLFHAGCSIAMTLYNLKNHPHLDDRLQKD